MSQYELLSLVSLLSPYKGRLIIMYVSISEVLLLYIMRVVPWYYYIASFPFTSRSPPLLLAYLLLVPFPNYRL